jgi:hypothetical protein
MFITSKWKKYLFLLANLREINWPQKL